MRLPEFRVLCCSAFILRVILIIYANFHDKYFRVPYTDVDYKVYTDAARYLAAGESPYLRHTYRYSPLLAFILSPNVFFHKDFGKLLFSLMDIFAGVLIKMILVKGKCNNKVGELCGLSWLFNPMTIVISTRGNADSLSVLLVLLTLYYLIINNDYSLLSGLIHGLSVHFRLYPIVFSLAMYLSLRYTDKFTILPNIKQFKFVAGFAMSLSALTVICYFFCGYEFVYESFIYHLIRKDARHNFSLYFYMLYLSTGQTTGAAETIVRGLPPLLLLLGLSFKFSGKNQLAFGMMTQAMVMVTYNSVVTSQYFFWYLSLLPVCVPYINISLIKYVILLGIWLIAQALWLFDAYCLEFLGLNKFHSIWVDSILFFFANIKVLYDFIVHFHCRI